MHQQRSGEGLFGFLTICYHCGESDSISRLISQEGHGERHARNTQPDLAEDVGIIS
jgi:hypothetical protein